MRVEPAPRADAVAGARGVLDSSVLATALVSPRGHGNALLQQARLHRFQLVVSAHVLAEVRATVGQGPQRVNNVGGNYI